MTNLQGGVLKVIVVAFVSAFSVSPAFAGLTDFEFGARAGFSLDDEDEDLSQYEIYGAFDLPWRSKHSTGWQYESMFDISAGVLEGGGETGGRFTVGIDLFLNSPDGDISLTTGFGAGVMTEDVYGETDFGGPVFFRFQGGVSYWITKSFSAGYRFLHESNGSIYDKNPSLNMHQFEIRMHF